MWYNEQILFETQATSFGGFCSNSPSVARTVRFFLLLIISTLVGFEIYNFGYGKEQLSHLIYLTQWGVWLTFFTLVFGNLARKPRTQIKNKRICRFWKVWTILYELTFVMEFTITLVFWTILYSGDDKCNSKSPVGIHEIECVNYLGDHCVPIFCLLCDYTINVQPLVKRHVWIVIFAIILYLIVNISATFYRGEPVYAPMDW